MKVLTESDQIDWELRTDKRRDAYKADLATPIGKKMMTAACPSLPLGNTGARKGSGENRVNYRRTWDSISHFGSGDRHLVRPKTIQSKPLVLISNEVAQVVHFTAYGTSDQVRLVVEIGDSAFVYYPETMANPSVRSFPIVAGPARLSLVVGQSAGGSQNAGFCTVQVTREKETFALSSTVVIPEDAKGPVNIILESSVDLVTWTSAVPGSYGSSTSKRFFRVRAQRSE